MVVSVRESSRQMKPILSSLENINRELPEYLSLEGDKFQGSLLAIPQLDQVPLALPINIPLVCEFISHTT
jgi:small subunit ribosomal protein S4